MVEGGHQIEQQPGHQAEGKGERRQAHHPENPAAQAMQQHGGDDRTGHHHHQPGQQAGVAAEMGEGSHRRPHQGPVEAVDAVAPGHGLGNEGAGGEIGRHGAQHGEEGHPGRLQQQGQQQQQAAHRVIDEDHLAQAAQGAEQGRRKARLRPAPLEPGEGAAGGQQPLKGGAVGGSGATGSAAGGLGLEKVTEQAVAVGSGIAGGAGHREGRRAERGPGRSWAGPMLAREHEAGIVAASARPASIPAADLNRGRGPLWRGQRRRGQRRGQRLSAGRPSDGGA